VVDTVDRGPYYKMLDRQAMARQSQTGESYAVAFTKVYEDPSNRTIVDASKFEDLAKAHDLQYGSHFSAIPVQKAAPYDPLQKAAELAESYGPAHLKMHSLAIDHQRAHPGMTYASAYGYLYAKPENVGLRNAIKAEHMSATMSAHAEGELGKAAPPDPPQDDVSPESAHDELERLVITRAKDNPKLSYEQLFTREYLDPKNRSLKERYGSESVAHMRRLAPAKPFPAYTSPGHGGDPSNVGRSGAKPRGYIGG
jgi:hypothetical protein